MNLSIKSLVYFISLGFLSSGIMATEGYETFEGKVPLSVQGGKETSFKIKIPKTQKFKVIIQTDRFEIRTLTKKDLPLLKKVFQDPKIAATLNSGDKAVFSDEGVQFIFDMALKNNQERNPYSTFLVFDKQDPEKFMGYTKIGDVDGSGTPGVSGFANAFLPQFQGQGGSSEVQAAMIRGFVPFLQQKGYQLNGAPLSAIETTIWKDNGPSLAIKAKNGFKVTQEESIELENGEKSALLTLRYDCLSAPSLFNNPTLLLNKPRAPHHSFAKGSFHKSFLSWSRLTIFSDQGKQIPSVRVGHPRTAVWGEMPVFSDQGKQITFVRVGYPKTAVGGVQTKFFS